MMTHEEARFRIQGFEPRQMNGFKQTVRNVEEASLAALTLSLGMNTLEAAADVCPQTPHC